MPSEKEVKAAVKEGGKKGQDIAGLFDMGGVSFFTLSMEHSNGEHELLQHTLDGMNKEVDENADDRKGGAGHIGKMLLSANDKKVAIICHVPEPLKEKMSIDEWLDAVVGPLKGTVLNKGDNVATAEILGDPAQERFPLKMRDEAINLSFALLKAKKLVVDDDSDDDDTNYAEAMGVEW